MLKLILINISLIIFSTFGLYSQNVYAKQIVEIAVFEEHFSLINTAFKQYGCSKNSINNAPKNQMVIEFLLLCHALKVSEKKYQLTPVPFPLHKRIRQQLYSGNISLSGMGMWLSYIDKKQVYASIPLLKSGEFTKGLYYLKNNKKVINNIGNYPFENLNAVINTNWKIDFEALKCAGLTVSHSDRYKSMFKMLAFRRADVVPHTFTNHPKMELLKEQQTLVPIHGYKIVFEDSLHFFISKKHPLAEELNVALNQGLSVLRNNGTIREAYEKIGIIRPETANWRTINCS